LLPFYLFEEHAVIMKSRMSWKERTYQRDIIILCLFTILGIAVYWNSLDNSFQYDDQLYVTDNLNIRSLKNIPRFFTHPRMLASDPYQAGHYRPLVVTSYALNYAAGGLNPAGYHLTNLAFHIGSAFLIYLILRSLSVVNKEARDEDRGERQSSAIPFCALAAGLIFLVHPFNSEAVNYITARSSVMSGFFYLTGFYCWIRFRGVTGETTGSSKGGASPAAGSLLPAVSLYLASFFSFVLGMLSKEVPITLPFTCLLYDICFYYSRKNLSWRTLVPYIPFVLIVVIPYAIIRSFTFGRVLPYFKRDIGTQLFTILPVIVKHWQMFIVPYPLTPLHYVEINHTFFLFPVVYSTIILTVYTVLGILIFRLPSPAWRVAAFFMFWFYIVLLPILIIPLNAIFQENRGYLAMASFAVIAGIVLAELRRIRLEKVAVVLLVLLIVVYSGVTIGRNRVWKDELTLWTDTVQKVPQSPMGYTALGVAYRRAGMYKQAIDASRKALALGGDDNFIAHDNLGRVYMAQELWDLAAAELEKAVRDYPNYPTSHIDLGRVYYKMGKLELAEREYREAIRLDPIDYVPYFNMGVLYIKWGRLEEAVQAFRRSLSLSPGHLRSRLNLAILLEETGKKEEAAEHYRQVLREGGDKDKTLVQEARSRLERMGKTF